MIAWLKRSSAEQMHDARGWRFMWVNAVLATIVGVGLIFADFNELASIMVLFGVVASFIGGYSYRQRVLDIGEKPSWGFLVLKDDPLLGAESGLAPAPDDRAASEQRAGLRRRLIAIHLVGALAGVVLSLVLQSVIVAVAIAGAAVFNVVVITILLSDRVSA